MRRKEFKSVTILKKILKENPKEADKVFKKVNKKKFSKKHPTLKQVLGKFKSKCPHGWNLFSKNGKCPLCDYK